MVTRIRAKMSYVTPHVLKLQSFTTYIDFITLFLSLTMPKIWFRLTATRVTATAREFGAVWRCFARSVYIYQLICIRHYLFDNRHHLSVTIVTIFHYVTRSNVVQPITRQQGMPVSRDHSTYSVLLF